MSNNKPYEIKIQASDFRPMPWDEVTVRYEGDTYATVQFIEKPIKTHVKRIDANTYKVLKTGEVREYNAMDEKAKNLARRVALKRTFRELRGIIRANFVNENEPGWNTQLFITLTYGENMTDEKRLYKDFKSFMDKLYYAYPDHEFCYVAVMEPQERGAWHVHLLLKVLNIEWFDMDNDTVTARLWKHGFTKTKRLKSNDVGAYYTAYFTSLVVETKEGATSEDILRAEEDLTVLYGILHDDSEELCKARKKGKRLAYYPKGMKLYRTSRNIIKPSKETQMLFELTDLGYEEIYNQTHEVSKVHLTGVNVGEIERLNRVHNSTYKNRR